MSMNVLCDHHHSSGRRGTFRAAGAVVGSVVAAAEEPWGADRAVQNVNDLRTQAFRYGVDGGDGEGA